MFNFIRNKIDTDSSHLGILIYVLEVKDIKTGTTCDQKFYFTRRQANKISNKARNDLDSSEFDVSYGGETLWIW